MYDLFLLGSRAALGPINIDQTKLVGQAIEESSQNFKLRASVLKAHSTDTTQIEYVYSDVIAVTAGCGY